MYRIQTLDLCDTGAVLYQVNCVYNKPTQWSAPSLLVGSIGRMVYWHRRDQGFKSTRTFQAFFSNCKNCIYNCDDLLSFHSSPCTYYKNYMIIILTILLYISYTNLYTRVKYNALFNFLCCCKNRPLNIENDVGHYSVLALR